MEDHRSLYSPDISDHHNATTNIQVTPYRLYFNEPAPMGIADYGIGNNGVPYNYSTSSFMGNVTINSISMYSPAVNSTNVTFQLNLNMVFYYHSIFYDYWVQDVAYLNTSSKQITFIDNIWNLSAPNADMFNSTVSGNGTVASSGSKSGPSKFYYDFPNSSLPGNNITLKNNSSFLLKMNAYLGNNDSPEVAFLYNDGYGWVVYDNAVFHFATGLKTAPYFYVSGYSYNPANTYYDAELVIGGPGNSTQSEDINSSIILMLEYYNGNNYQTIQNAFNFGSDTGETIYNAVVAGTYGSITGRLAAYVTGGIGSLEAIYYSNSLSSLKITTDIPRGALYVRSLNYTGNALNVTSFVGGLVNVTLYPGKYSIEVYSYSTGTFQNYGNVTLMAGRQTILPNDSYEVSFVENGLPSGISWYVDISGINSSAINGSQYVVFLQNGSYNFTVFTTDKDYTILNQTGSIIINGSSQRVNVHFIPMLFAIHFIESGLPNGTLWSVILNGKGTLNSSNDILIFDVTNGTYDYLVPSTFDYAPLNHTGSVTVNGSDVIVPVPFTIMDGYLVGKITPSTATISINGTTYRSSNGNFNISLKPGNYTVNVTAPGYVSFVTNVTILPSHVTKLQITGLLKRSNDIVLFEILVFLIIILGGIWSFMQSRRRR
ncbi:MAG: thermopsin family protease [Thermoplasmata archaeon]